MKASMEEESQFKAIYDQYLNWKASQEGQQYAYEYERSFDAFCQQVNKQTLEMAYDKLSSVKKKSIPSSAK